MLEFNEHMLIVRENILKMMNRSLEFIIKQHSNIEFAIFNHNVKDFSTTVLLVVIL